MQLRLALVLGALTIVLAFAACGDDDDKPSGSAIPASTTPATTGEPGGDSPTPVDTSDGKTETPGPGTQTVVPTAPGEVPTPPPTASEGTPAIKPDDEAAFLARFEGAEITFVTCVYNPSTALTDCGDNGKYAIDPPIVGQDITCELWIVEGESRAIQCRSVEPAQTVNYEIG